MARPGQRRKTKRVQGEERFRPVNLQPSRRYFIAGGYDKNVRAARALERAFQVGSEFATDEMFRRNAEGRRQALLERGSGATERDAANEQAGYNRAWDELDAEFDFNLAVKELPEQLRGFDWENQSETDVQQFVSDYMARQFSGLENMKGSAYAEYLAPRLLKLETEIIAQHRDMQIAKVQEEQRTKIYANAEAQLEADGKLDYQKLFERTGTFFDGAAKKEVFWETVYDLAIKAGNPDLITDMPVQINGIPTGIKDPKLQDAHRQAIDAATRAGLAKQAAAEKELEARNEQLVFDLQSRIAEKAMKGESTLSEINQLRALVGQPGGPSWSDVQTATTFGQGQADEFDSRSMDLNNVSQLWADIYAGKASLSDIFQARNIGLLGTGPQAVDTMEEMMSTVNMVRQSGDRASAPSVSAFRNEITARYNPQTQGMFAPLDQTVLHIRNSALAKYNQLVLVDGIDPAEAAQQVKEQFDPLIDANVDTAKSQSAFERDVGVVSAAQIKAAAAGRLDARRVFAGQTQPAIEGRLFDLLESGEITDQEAEQIVVQLFN